MTLSRTKLVAPFLIAVLLALLAACTPAGPQGAAPSPTPEPAPTETAEPPLSPAESGENPVADSSWELVSLAGTPVTGELTLDFAGDTLSGSDGCNSFSGSYTATGGTLAIDALAATERACLEEGVMARAQQYRDALMTAGAFSLDGERLTVATEEGELLFARPGSSAALEGTRWTLLQTIVGGDAAVPVPAAVRATLVFTDGMVSGYSGCNSFGGPVSFDGGEAIGFGPLVTTRMACAEEQMAVEEAMLAALEKAAAYTVADGVLELRDGEGLRLASFAATEQKTLYVGPEQAECVGEGSQQCLLVREEPTAEYEFFYDTIAGFEWESGYEYELLVGVSEVPQPPAGGSSLRYTLLEVVEKAPEADNPLTGTVWQWVRYEDMADMNNIDVEAPANYTIQFMDDGTYALQADCNSGSGRYTQEGSGLSIEPGVTTLVACGEDSLDEEFRRMLGDVATFVLADDGTLYLNLKMDAGNMVFAAGPGGSN